MTPEKIRKGMWIWNVPEIEGGDPVLITVKLLEAGVTEVYIKAADGPYVFSQYKKYGNWGENLKKELVDQLTAAGIDVYGWGFCYGHDPKGEGKIAGMQVERFGLKGWLFDVESESDRQEKADSNGVHTCLAFRKISDKPIYLCWWALFKKPNQDPESQNRWHPDSMPAKQLISAWDPYVKGYFPMAYWETWAGDLEGLETAPLLVVQCVAQYRELTLKAIFIVGRAYTGDGGVAFPEAMQNFAEKAVELGCEGVSWWSMEHAVRSDHIWGAIGEINDGIGAGPSPALPVNGEGGTNEEEVIDSTPAEDSSTCSENEVAEDWRVVNTALLNIRIAPVYDVSTKRTQLKRGDEIQVLPGGMESKGERFVPVVLYVAERLLKGGDE